jgi:hypothetical protein
MFINWKLLNGQTVQGESDSLSGRRRLQGVSLFFLIV